MGRPFGSKNKLKEVEEKSPRLKEAEAFLAKTAEETKPAAEEKWTPAPDMGSIKPPSPLEDSCSCGHKKGVHYGGPKGWCNQSGCKCGEFNQ